MLYQQYRDRVRFLLVYIREAHPIDGWKMPDNEAAGIRVTDPTTFQERQAVAETACTKLHIDFPAAVDGIDNQVGIAYAGWPDRLYVVRPDGTIGFKSGPGPWGFDADALADYLKQTVGPPDAAAAAPVTPAGLLPQVGKPAPAVEGASINGTPISLAALKGKVVLLDFWAVWCPPCQAAMPGMVRLYRKFHDRGLEMVGVTIDGGLTGTTAADVKRVTAAAGAAWPQLYEGKGWDNPTVVRYGVDSPPTAVLVGADGNVLMVAGADTPPEKIDAAVAAALKG